MITLITDFGTTDPYVGIMKGVILSENPSTPIIDITHEILPQDVAGAAYCIYSVYRYFPAGSIHVVVVDPGVGSSRSIIAVSMAGHFFLAPDNGLLGLILSTGNVDFITTVENEKYFLKPVSRTFHGRDIFAPVAAHLSKGLPIERLGNEIKKDQVLCVDLPMPYQAQSGELVGEVIHVDRFGNLITNIDHLFIRKTFDLVNDRDLTIIIGGHQISGLSACYQDTEPQSLLAISGSMGFIEISINCGNASKFCGAARGDAVLINMVNDR